MDKKQLKEIVIQQRIEIEKKDRGIERDDLKEIERYLKIPHVLIISGVRRSGKSTLLTQIMSEWFDQDYYYISFEDERLISFCAQEDFDVLYQVFLELYGEKKTFFLDEIQNVSGWERFVRRMYEREFKFIITGSNAKLLSFELATHLTGRHLTKEIYPFSFRVCELIQVCYLPGKETKKREIRSLLEAMDEFALKEGLIITEDDDKELAVDGRKIIFKPLWKWLLDIA
jgi:hypothetical protein